MPSRAHSTAHPFQAQQPRLHFPSVPTRVPVPRTVFRPRVGFFTAPLLVARPIWRALKVRPRLEAASSNSGAFQPGRKLAISVQPKPPTADPICFDTGQFYRPGVSKDSVAHVAEAMASLADFRTGRNCWPSLRRLMKMTRCSRRVVQRARRVLEILGLASLVAHNRRRTLVESISSQCCGDSSRG